MGVGYLESSKPAILLGVSAHLARDGPCTPEIKVEQASHIFSLYIDKLDKSLQQCGLFELTRWQTEMLLWEDLTCLVRALLYLNKAGSA